ncbi:hypothetical protein AYI68_g7506 [Smittium mucronatum]|uniref:Reverse transcriptase zinc-binding domain-containing protein n=1 Tax=Smittium mucronatum TaxID=133383 RepID=A0A1R0GNH9_9FUNG|nr:hypothetical protein AYI68_g7506 [Smittium mucronatum]
MNKSDHKWMKANSIRTIGQFLSTCTPIGQIQEKFYYGTRVNEKPVAFSLSNSQRSNLFENTAQKDRFPSNHIFLGDHQINKTTNGQRRNILQYPKKDEIKKIPKWEKLGIDPLNQTDFQWRRVYKLPIEPKMMSHLWLIYHNVIITGEKLNIWNKGIYDPIQKCNFCDHTMDNIIHGYYECNRTKEYWNLIGKFLKDSQIENTEELIIIGSDDVFDQLNRLKKIFPNIATVQALAIWNIHRSRTEMSLANKNLPYTALFIRFINMLKDKITADMTTNNTKLKDSWAKIKTKWFAIEPGGRVNFNS